MKLHYQWGLGKGLRYKVIVQHLLTKQYKINIYSEWIKYSL